MRGQRGERHGMAKLSDADVVLIREAADERERLKAEARKLSDASLAEKFGVHHKTISNIVNYRIWRHI